ncbi:MAG: T9SS type A sorting domain-containing protein [candidate division Zixibacteria bacterium]|nr:T9SS type A sorting domain-containing protein [candidate division Zixibacteria bacterium]
MFIDPANNDFNLQVDSPCIASGRYSDDRGALPYIQTSVDDSANQPTQLALFSCYPNPFNATTTIEYNLLESGFVTVEIFNILGEKVTTLVNGRQPAGHKKVSWNAAGVASGTYFYKIQADDWAETKKMSLLK